MGRILTLVVALMALAWPLAAQVATTPHQGVGVGKLPARFLTDPPAPVRWRPAVVQPPVQLAWHLRIWDFVKAHPALMVPVVLWMLSLLGDHGDDLVALLLMGAAVALIVWGLASLWESRSSQWFVWIGSTILAVLAFGMYKLYAHSAKAAGIIELLVALAGLPIAVFVAKDKGLPTATLPMIGSVISFARGLDKVRTALKPAAPPAAEPAKVAKPRRTRPKKNVTEKTAMEAVEKKS